MNGRIGSLFSGYGGLDMGVQAALGGSTAWVSDVDPGASKILAHRYPDIPNIGDITKVRWDQVEPVDVLTGGFPCQDVSAAGKRLGMKPGTRSGLWSHMAYAIDQLRPSLVVAENVRGLLSASAHSDLEPCPWCLGDGGDVSLRALGGVLGDLADLGYDASWQGLRASDVGAPHGRFRVFVIAWPAADTDHLRHERSRGARNRWTGSANGVVAAADPIGSRLDGGSRDSQRLTLVGAPAARPGEGARRGGLAANPDDTTGDGERARTEPGQGDQGPGPHTAGIGRGASGWDDGVRAEGLVARYGTWGRYAAAIERWERVTRPSPSPHEPGRTGQPRLAPAFSEWLMGLPAGWVTQVPDLTRNEQLHALGNGVVPQQAAEALRLLLPDRLAAAS